MANYGRYVFRATRDAHEQLTRLFDFMHPTAIAMWNLRWQVRGFVEYMPQVTSDQLASRFALGSNLSAGSLRRATVETSWDSQLEQFGSVVLITTIAIFEDFTARIGALRFPSSVDKQKKLADHMQFPLSNSKKNWQKAVGLMGSSTQTLVGAVQWDPAVLRRADKADLDKLLVAYRYFKEVRNSIAHNGGRASERAKTAYDAFAAAIVDGKIGGANLPEHKEIKSNGDPVSLTYRGVVGFSDIVLRIITLYEIEMTKYGIVEQELSYRVSKDNRAWPTDAKRVDKRMISLMQAADFPSITLTQTLRAYLIDNGYVPAYAI